ncbi:MAG: class I SAM-dependent methyltransferase [Saccharofermentans sp.]|jgi:23S rRNA (cytosine1962-C5)-methyltransferase|nr:class I SAM-dependent methyltransferase [Mageeibacillus sp.]MCI1263404.1 class I SAM-dependent methyltransferase [Saccharofermentans sp.]MCI1274857.1 class I SAM-dependent methyltransferase [Saccharofermentans sp.]MCI1769073.1 class I SAM-dependent methyltransferase [Mageeibacillus sp.]MCI2044113.1 class I SAM-dependent methyltransferase [Mageeibacillus sp.]
MFVSDKWQDYEILYAGGGEKYERWGDITLRRPDPQAIWPVFKDGREISMDEIERPCAVYNRSSEGGGSWTKLRPLPESWKINYDSLGKKLRFIVEPTSFKHTGLFPEQAANWDFCGDLIDRAVRSGRDDIKVLNLFAYTGAATVACSAHGAAEVVHVDASKGMIGRAKENMAESGIADRFVRFIADDCRKFVEREIRRGHRYDGIIMDPPSYGRGPSGELWKLEDSFYDFARMASMLLTDNPLFFIASSYATGITCEASGQILSLATSGTGRTGKVSAGELGLHVSGMGVNLPCGSVARWTET